MSKSDHLLRIGQFADASLLSIKALRLYDRLGILQPAHLDPESGYRYYQSAQLPTARFIRTLRQMDMPLALVRQLIEADRETAVALLTQYRQTYEARALLVRRTTEELIIYLKEVRKMTLEVEVKELAPQQVASITKHVTVQDLDKTIKESIYTLQQFAQKGEMAGPTFGIFHGTINETDNGPIEICHPVNGSLVSAGEIVVKELPAGKAAAVAIYGDMCEFPHILKAYDAAYDWIRENGYEIAESPREIWWSEPGSDAHMEVVWPFRER